MLDPIKDVALDLARDILAAAPDRAKVDDILREARKIEDYLRDVPEAAEIEAPPKRYDMKEDSPNGVRTVQHSVRVDSDFNPFSITYVDTSSNAIYVHTDKDGGLIIGLKDDAAYVQTRAVALDLVDEILKRVSIIPRLI